MGGTPYVISPYAVSESYSFFCAKLKELRPKGFLLRPKKTQEARIRPPNLKAWARGRICAHEQRPPQLTLDSGTNSGFQRVTKEKGKALRLGDSGLRDSSK